jgi:protocatechuate 3,4-dioxygenase alpha subunit
LPETTPSQTVGPYFALGLTWEDGPHVVPEGTEGAFWLRGRIIDGAGDPVPDAIIETWQPDPEGRFPAESDPRGTGFPATPDFRGLGRSGTDADGAFAIHTVKPGSVPARDGTPQAPFVAVSVFARGMLDRVVTRFYFADEAEANAADPVLASLTEDERATLIAAPSGDGYVRDVRLQGAGETVFFRI